MPTFGGHSTSPPDKLDQLLSGITTAIQGIGGSFTMNYAALALLAHRLDDQAPKISNTVSSTIEPA